MKLKRIGKKDKNINALAILNTVTGFPFLLLALIFSSSALALHPISSVSDIISQYPVYPSINYSALSNSDAVKRGEYLVKVGDCIACHTDNDSGPQAFAGGLPISTAFGTFYTPNITPDLQTGIGSWSEADFITVMHEGILANGSNAFPAFPYVYFNRVTTPDLKDIWAYLQALPAISKNNLKNTLPFPIDVRFFQYGWKMLYFYPDAAQYVNRPDKSKQWNRGAYLVEGLGHCTMCHTPMNLIGAEQNKYYLTGAFIEGYWAPDISSRGLKTATRFQVAKVFVEGQLINHAGKVRGPMADANHDSLRHLTKSDRLAIAEYLKSVVSHQPRNIPVLTATQEPLKKGHQVYANVCVICHLNGDVGAPRIGDQANWQNRVFQSGLSGLYRHAVDGFNKMPAKGACVTCLADDVTDAVDYILYHSLQHSKWNELKHQAKKPQPISTSLKSGQIIYEETCSVCHEQGQLGAPVVGNQEQWAPLLNKNIDQLIINTVSGINNMPPKGGCSQCTGSEIIAAVKYMAQQSQENHDYSLW